MAIIYVDYYNKYGEEKTYDFVLRTKVALSVLNSLYNQFLTEPDENVRIVELGKLPEEKKQKFWDIACKYFTELPDRLKASKAAYVISLITSND